ncbi:MAG: ribosome recycling factor [Myxococcota bacterium]|jgi:ribosome recycling factor|nr:ribosome recycling factor [Myxococcota bacterium]
MLDEVFNDLTESFEDTLKGLARELSKLRTGRANLGMLDGVRVEFYGQMVPINQVATMKIADARLIVIQPWDKSVIATLEKAIASSDLGFNPSNDGTVIRVPVPALTGERRQELVKIARKVGEEHKISLRNSRRDGNDMLKALEKDSEITEDDLHRGLARVNSITEEYTKKIDDIVTAKEADILEV